MDNHRAAFAGQLEELPVAELIRMTAHDGQSGIARFETPRGSATLWFSNGEVVDAQMGRFHLENALTRLLDVQSGTFEVEYKPITRRRLLVASTLDLLADWERKKSGTPDEGQLHGPRKRTSRRKTASWFPTGGGLAQPLEGASLLQNTPRAIRSTEMAELAAREPAEKPTPARVPTPPFSGPGARGEEQGPGRTVARLSRPVRVPEEGAPTPRMVDGANETTPSEGIPGVMDDAASGIISVGTSWEAPAAALRPSSQTIHSGQSVVARGVIDASAEEVEESSVGPQPTQTQTYLSREALRRPSVDVVWRPRTEKAVAQHDDGLESVPAPEPATAAGPALVGRYEVLLRLARGGMGTVYLCRVTGHGGFRRLFALKVIRDHLSRNDEYVTMLLQEAHIASRLHHPNVVSIIDMGVLANQHYLVMDYVEGCTFSELLKAHPRVRPPHLILPVLLDALAGLHAAHTLTDDDGQPLTLVHCDFSPQNMLLGTNGVCRITDFGVARAADALPGKTRGKPGYLAPEQIRGRNFDHRADLFAAGVVLWNALTGEALFSGESTEEILDQVLHKKISPPSEVGLRPPSCLDEVCMRALERDPDRRYQSAEEMFMELRSVAIDHGLLAPAHEVGQWVTDSFGPQLQLRRQAAGLAPAAAARRPVPVPELGLGQDARESGDTEDDMSMGPGDSGSRTTVLREDELPPELILRNDQRRRNAVLGAMAAMIAGLFVIAFAYPELIRGGYVDDKGAYREIIPEPATVKSDAVPATVDPKAVTKPPAPVQVPVYPAEPEPPSAAEKDEALAPEISAREEADASPAAAESDDEPAAEPATPTKPIKTAKKAAPAPRLDPLPPPPVFDELPPPVVVEEPPAKTDDADDWEVKKIEAPPPVTLPSGSERRSSSAQVGTL